MRILLIQSLSVEGMSAEKVYPIGLVSLAGLITRPENEVALIDLNIHPDPFRALREKLVEFNPDVAGISLRNIDPLGNKASSLIPPFVAVVRMVATICPRTRIIAGGTGFSLFPERLMLELPEISYGIIGEAEESFPALIASLDNPPSLKGLCRRKGDGIIITPPSREYDMAHYEAPDRTLLDPAQYLDINTYVPAIGIETKRGCPYKCAYCVYPKLQGTKLRCRLPHSVVDEMESLHKEYGIKSFHFTDPVVNIPGGHLEDICREILRRKLLIRWDGFMRENLLTGKNVSLYVKAGCECFSFSPDGYCGEALEMLGKGMGEEDILKAARLVSKTDVITVYHFMVNVPGETKETAEKGIKLFDRLYDLHAAKRNLGTIVLNNIRIHPGTRIEEIARRDGVIGPNTDLLYPTYYNPAPFESLRYKLETMHYLRNIFSWEGLS
ncbi:MAG: B12 lower ligand biosynthesis radical SAM protein BzaD [Thermodesulfovibrio sp.]|nr:B12 lower ligand biosynthesis radical SAM protein BzaD [Thermodesulfovibrio sp.]